MLPKEVTWWLAQLLESFPFLDISRFLSVFIYWLNTSSNHKLLSAVEFSWLMVRLRSSDVERNKKSSMAPSPT